MAATVTVTIVNGQAVVVADGTKVSCEAASAVEKALGTVTKSVPTGHTAATAKVVAR